MDSDTPPKVNKTRHRRGKSETLRLQYINTKEVRYGGSLFILPCQTRGTSLVIVN